MSTTLVLIAQDNQIKNLIDFINKHKKILSRYQLIAPELIAQNLQRNTGLNFEIVPALAQGGDLQIAAKIINNNEVGAVIFLLDQSSTLVPDPTIQTLFRSCNLRNIPFATNLATAEAIAIYLTQFRFAYLIFNPVSGQSNAEQDLLLIRQCLEPYLQLKLCLTTPEVSAEQLAEEAVNDKADLVIASGGDGTVSAVASRIIGSGIPLGIIPRGTANAFCAALGIPNTIVGACNVILTGLARVVDAARCNDTPMVLLAGIGYEAETVNRANREAKQRWGPLAYIMAGWQQLHEQTLFYTEIEIDGKVSQFEAAAITIANAAPPTSILAQGLGQVIADDNLLEVLIVSPNNKLQAISAMLEMLGSALLKTKTQREDTIGVRAKRVKVTTDPPQKVVLDGEIVGTTPIEVECIPNGLIVLAPSALPSVVTPELPVADSEEITEHQSLDNS